MTEGRHVNSLHVPCANYGDSNYYVLCICCAINHVGKYDIVDWLNWHITTHTQKKIKPNPIWTEPKCLRHWYSSHSAPTITLWQFVMYPVTLACNTYAPIQPIRCTMVTRTMKYLDQATPQSRQKRIGRWSSIELDPLLWTRNENAPRLHIIYCLLSCSL